jgi:hypothetical protein
VNLQEAKTMKVFNILLLTGISTTSLVYPISATDTIKEFSETESSIDKPAQEGRLVYTREEILELKKSPLSNMPLENIEIVNELGLNPNDKPI